MAVDHGGNGSGLSNGDGWPSKLDEDLPEPSLLPSAGSWRELAQGYATALFAWYEWLKAIVLGLHFVKGAAIRADGHAERAGNLARDARDEARGARVVSLAVAAKLGVDLTTLASHGLGPDGMPHGGVPPMRAPADSSSTEIAEIQKSIAPRRQRLARKLKDEKDPDAIDRDLQGFGRTVIRAVLWTRKTAKAVGYVLGAAGIVFHAIYLIAKDFGWHWH